MKRRQLTQATSAVIENAVDRALSVQQPVIARYIRRVTRSNPDATPDQIISGLTKYYLATVTTSGGAAGAAAAVPGVGIATGLTASALDLTTFLEASAIYVLALAEVHEVPVHDLARRRTLVLGIVMGNGGSSAVQKMAGRTAPHWAKAFVNSVPMSTINNINRVLGPRFVTKYGTKQGVLVLSKQVPLGIGAGLGAGGNAGFGYLVVRSARRAFGDPPALSAVTAKYSTPSTDVASERIPNEEPSDAAVSAGAAE